MIYLIGADYYEESEENNKLGLLKIGYTKEEGMKIRFAQYRLHNPKARLLYEIPGLSEIDEKKLHYKFRSHKYLGYGNEWFRYSQEIVDFFQELSKNPSIMSDIPIPPVTRGNENSKYRQMIRSCVGRVYSWITTTPRDIDLEEQKKMIDKILDIAPADESEVWTMLAKEFGEDIITQIHEYRASQECLDFMKVFEGYVYFTDRMKYICSTPMIDSTMKEILDQVPLEYKKYYLALGPDRIKANGYQRSRLEKEYKLTLISSIGGGTLKEKIYSEFKEGERYKLTNIKQTLQKIYENFGLTSITKAKDLGRYFETKSVRVLEKLSTGGYKKIRGYELIKKKDI